MNLSYFTIEQGNAQVKIDVNKFDKDLMASNEI
jgi:hypothetical protein